MLLPFKHDCGRRETNTRTANCGTAVYRLNHASLLAESLPRCQYTGGKIISHPTVLSLSHCLNVRVRRQSLSLSLSAPPERLNSISLPKHEKRIACGRVNSYTAQLGPLYFSYGPIFGLHQILKVDTIFKNRIIWDSTAINSETQKRNSLIGCS